MPLEGPKIAGLQTPDFTTIVDRRVNLLDTFQPHKMVVGEVEMSRANVATYRIAGLAICSLLMFGCGGGGGGGGNNNTPPPPASSDASLSSLSVTGVALVPAFSPSVTSYTATVPISTNSVDVSVTTSDNNASFTINGSTNASVGIAEGDNTISIVVTAENGTTTRTYTIVVTSRLTFAQEAYIKASNTDANDTFGYSVTLSDDGNTLAVGARKESSAATGLNGDQADNSAQSAGAVYVFTRDTGGVWTQQAYVKASNTGAYDGFGWDVTLSDDGNTLAVGAHYECSTATGVNGNQPNDSAPAAGAVYVFTRDSGGVWMQQAYVKASNTDAYDYFGTSVTLSDDGNALAVGARYEESAATGANGDQADNNAQSAGAVYAFTRDTGGVWTQQAYVKASNTDAGDFFGFGVTLSDDGNTLAVGAGGEGSAAIGANGDQADNSTSGAGAVYALTRDTGGVWTQQAYVKASNTDAGDVFGISVTLSDDGNTLAVGGHFEKSATIGVNGDQTDNSVRWAGAVYVFTRDTGGVWTQQAYVKASNTDANDVFGFSVALSGDGNTLAVGAGGEKSAATGVNGDQADNNANHAGAVYVFTRGTGGVWTQQAYVKASNTNAGDDFGLSVTLSDDGNTLAVGAESERSAATGVNGDQADNSVQTAGAVYVFARGTGGVWTQQAYVKASNTDSDHFGISVTLSGDGNTLAVGSHTEDSAATGVNGDQADNSAQSAGAVYVFRRGQ